MEDEAIARANELLQAKGYAERDLAVHRGPRDRALLKGNKILSPFSDDAATVLHVVEERVPSSSELGARVLRAADLRQSS